MRAGCLGLRYPLWTCHLSALLGLGLVLALVLVRLMVVTVVVLFFLHLELAFFLADWNAG